jgi:hypothetical protein
MNTMSVGRIGSFCPRCCPVEDVEKLAVPVAVLEW